MGFLSKVGILHGAFPGVGLTSGAFIARGRWIGFSLTGSGAHLFLAFYALGLPPPLSPPPSVCCVPGTVLSFTVLPHSALTTALQGCYCIL